MEKKPFILFITGISCSGKSALADYIKNNSSTFFENSLILDIDDKPVPPNDRDIWRRYRVVEVFRKAKNRLDLGESTIISGIVFPMEIINSDLYNPKENVLFVNFSTSLRKFKDRLKERLEKSGEKVDIDELLTLNKIAKDNLHKQCLSYIRGFEIEVENLTLDETYCKLKEIVNILDKR